MKIRTSIKTNPSCFYVIAAANLLIGMTIISQSNIWQWNAAFLVTVLGWVLILRGILSLFVPKIVIQFTLENKELMKFLGIIPLIWGISLCWFAFS